MSKLVWTKDWSFKCEECARDIKGWISALRRQSLWVGNENCTGLLKTLVNTARRGRHNKGSYLPIFFATLYRAARNHRVNVLRGQKGFLNIRKMCFPNHSAHLLLSKRITATGTAAKKRISFHLSRIKFPRSLCSAHKFYSQTSSLTLSIHCRAEFP